MRTIHKYTVHAGDTYAQTITTSFAARPVHAAYQHGDPELISVWFELDNEAPRMPRTLLFVMTGGEVPEGAGYISTHQFNGGRFVLHLYELAQ